MSVNPVDTLNQHFDVFDTAAKGGNTDGKISREDLEAVANGGSQYTYEQREAARQLLQDDALFAQFDTANQGGGLHTADGIISRNDVDAVVADAPLYEDTSAFRSDHSTLPQDAGRGNGADATPMEAAAQVEFVAGSSLGGGEDAAVGQFMHLVGEHADDPAWLKEFFGALGSERTAHLLDRVASPGRYGQYWSADDVNANIEAITGALQSMYAGGQLNDADIARLVEHWAMERGDFNTGIAQVIADMHGPGADGLQNAFFRAATELGLAGQDVSNREFTFSDDAIDRLSDGDRESLAGAAAHVLAQTGQENQVNQLINLRIDGGDAALDRFITLAMANPTSVAAFDTFTSDAQQARLLDPEGAGPAGQEVDYDGVAQLVQTLSFDTTYRGGPDRHLPPSPYSYATLQEVRDVVFYSASNGLDANTGEWADNTTLKDGLSRIFMADYDRMVDDATTANGARLDDDHPLPKALENFTAHVLFTQPPGHLRDQASEFLITELSTTIEDINSMSDAEFMDKYGATQAQMAHITGSVLGHVNNGMEQAVASAADKRAAQQEALEFGLNLAWALGQDGLKLLPGGNLASAILPDSITGSETYGAIKGELESRLRQGLTDEAADLVLEEFPDLNPDDALTGLARELSEVVSVDNERDFLSSFLSSYTDVDQNPAAG